MSGTVHQGVTFFEGYPEDLVKGEKISTKLDGFLKSSQSLNLSDVKTAMANECKAKGGNCIVGFTYGQRSLGFFASLLSRDDVVWYGEGYISRSSDIS